MTTQELCEEIVYRIDEFSIEQIFTLIAALDDQRREHFTQLYK